MPWRKRTELEKGLLVLAFIFFVAAVVFFVLFLQVYLAAPKKQTEIPEVCTTFECLQTAAYISDSLDPTVDPCEDFYQYTCGRWAEKNPRPLSIGQYDNMAIIRKNVEQSMIDLLSGDESNSIGGIVKAKHFYESCEDTDAIKAKGITPLVDFLKKRGTNLFPTIEPNWVDENLTLSQVESKVDAVGSISSFNLFEMTIEPHMKELERNIIAISQPKLNLKSRHVYLGKHNDNNLLNYQMLYVHVMTLLGANSTTAKRDVTELVDFEILVANATDPPEVMNDYWAGYSNDMTVRQLTARYPQFDWLPYLQKQFSNVTMDEEVIILTDQYFDKIFSIVEAAPRRTLMNYCMWTLVFPLIDFLDQKLIYKSQESSNARQATCVARTIEKFVEATGRLYVDRNFSNCTKQHMENIMENLMAAVKEILQESDWLTEPTKRAALEKAEAMIQGIGYPNVIMNDTALNGICAECNITSDSYFDNQIAVQQHTQLTDRKNLRAPSIRHRLPISVATVNAFYNPFANTINMLAGILNKPFLSEEFLDALNYGGIGFAVGHEIIHGFDSNGRGFDKEGRLHNWQEPQDLKQFTEGSECMEKQYSNFTEPSLKVKLNGILTNAEDIADNGGLKVAYRTWCGDMTEATKLYLLHTETHSLHRFRVIGSFQNNEDFSKAFSCPVGSYMNPQHKCRVW